MLSRLAKAILLFMASMLAVSAVCATGAVDAGDLAADGRRAAHSGMPIVVMFSADHCPYCRQVRRDYIDPLGRDPNFRPPVLVRIVTTDGDFTLTDFKGRKTTHTRFAFEQGISIVPTVRFFGTQGEVLTHDLVGASLPDFYLDYLEGSIRRAAGKLKQGKASIH